MIENINEYDFYMGWEHPLLNEKGNIAVLAFTSPKDINSSLLVTKLERLSEVIDINILVIDINDCEYLLQDLNVHSAPCVLVYNDGEEVMRFSDDFNESDMITDVYVFYCDATGQLEGGDYERLQETS